MGGSGQGRRPRSPQRPVSCPIPRADSPHGRRRDVISPHGGVEGWVLTTATELEPSHLPPTLAWSGCRPLPAGIPRTGPAQFLGSWAWS